MPNRRENIQQRAWKYLTATEICMASWIEDQITGAIEDARIHGVKLAEYPRSYKSRQMQEFEKQHGPLKHRITATEAIVIDHIWHEAEKRSKMTLKWGHI